MFTFDIKIENNNSEFGAFVHCASTYYFLFNYRGWTAKEDRERKCPLTGNDWLIEEKTDDDFYAFKCDESRLVSELSSNTNDAEFV